MGNTNPYGICTWDDERVDAYLAHNPVMRADWEKSGYRLELSLDAGSNDRRTFG